MAKILELIGDSRRASSPTKSDGAATRDQEQSGRATPK